MGRGARARTSVPTKPNCSLRLFQSIDSIRCRRSQPVLRLGFPVAQILRQWRGVSVWLRLTCTSCIVTVHSMFPSHVALCATIIIIIDVLGLTQSWATSFVASIEFFPSKITIAWYWNTFCCEDNASTNSFSIFRSSKYYVLRFHYLSLACLQLLPFK